MRAMLPMPPRLLSASCVDTAFDARRIHLQPRAPCISPLHTHDTTGSLHTESATAVPNRLGQFFTEWGVIGTPPKKIPKSSDFSPA